MHRVSYYAAMMGFSFEKLKGYWERVFRWVRENRLLWLFAVLPLVAILAGFIIGGSERSIGNDTFNGVKDGIWFAVVTLVALGYGEKYPISTMGRFITIVLMFFGLSFSAVFTAIIASYFVERRMRDAKGMGEIKWKGHIVLCGWNSRAMSIVQKLTAEGSKAKSLVLVNDLPEEDVVNILQEVKSARVKYTRGDFVREGVLQRANVEEAETVVILADTYGAKAETRPDDRAILAAFAVRSLNTNARLCAEVEREDSVAHLNRANADIIVQTDAHNPFLIVNAALSPGVTLAFQDLLNWDYGHSILQKRFPVHLVGKNYSEAFRYFREKENALLIGLTSEEEEGMNLDDILTGDISASAIDRFIRKKFEGRENTYFQKRKKLNVKFNLPDSYVLGENDMALFLMRCDVPIAV